MSESPFVFVGDRLEVRDAKMLARLDRKRWSASGMKSIENCPASWAVDKLLPRTVDPFGPAELGVAAHKVLESFFALPMPERTEARAMEILSTLESDHGDEVDAPDTPAALLEWRGQVAAKVNGIFALENPTAVDVFSCEREQRNVVGGAPFIGYVDRIDTLPDGSLRVVDYKGLALDTLIPTPRGFITMAEVAEGDEVFGSDGRACHVVGTSRVHHRDCWVLRLDGAEDITCDDIHLWNVLVDNQPFCEVTAAQLAGWLAQGHEVSIVRPVAIECDIDEPLPEPASAHGMKVATGEAELLDAYLFASVEQRRELMLGMVQVPERLRADRFGDAFAEVCASLGMGTRAGDVEVRVLAVEPTAPVATRCIAVDSPDHTYLATRHFVVTHNSGKTKYPTRYGDDHGDQIRLYAASLRNDGFGVTQGALYYIGGRNRRDVVLRDDDLRRVVGDFVSTYDEMKASADEGSYRTRPSPLCGWCPLATVCPTAAKNNRSTPKVPRATLGVELGVRTEVSTPVAAPVATPVAEVFTPAPELGDDGVPAPPTTTLATPVASTPKRKKRPVHAWSATEDKSWVPRLADGSLNPNGYEAMAYTGTASLAAEFIYENYLKALDQQAATKAAEGVVADAPKPPTVSDIAAFTKTVAYIVLTVETQLLNGGRVANWSMGLNTRVRGVVRSVMNFTPAPFGGSVDDWGKWVTTVTKRSAVIMDNAMELMLTGPGEAPWTALGTATTTQE